MMAAYQPNVGGVHQGLPHGHPGMAPNPGQPHMGQPMMPMSGAPHVSQPGAMVGMQPGAQGMGPAMGGQHPAGMHMQAQMGGQSMAGGMPQGVAMSHMTPQQQMAMQQQMAANPQLAQQQHMMRMRQQQMMQQAQVNGMMGMHQGVPMNPQQIAQLQQLQQQQQHAQQQGVQGGNPSVQLPAHLQMQQQALQHQQQQRLAQQQQQQQQQHQQQQQQLAQQMAMQQTASQQSNPSQAAQPNPQGQPNNPQMRPQSRMANPNEQGQQNQQQHPQSGQAQQGQAQTQQTPQQVQPPGLQQAGQQQMAMQQRQLMVLQRQQQQALQQRMQAAQQSQQQTQPQGQHPGVFILRLLHFSDHLGHFTDTTGKDITNWHNFVDKHFAADGRLIHSFEAGGNPSGRAGKVFEVLRPTVARYFWTYFDSGCSSIRLHTEHAREVPHTSGGQSVLCQNATFSVSYPNGARLEMIGSLQVLFQAGTDSIECLQFQTANTEEIVSRTQIERVLSDWSPSLPTKSPKMAKNKLPKAAAKMQEQQERLSLDHFPKTPKGTYGITSKVQQFLEIGETMNIMSDLMHYSQEKKMRPEHALEALNQQYELERNGQVGNPQINLPPNGVAQGNRTPSMQNMQMPNGQPGSFASPSVSNMSLPMQNGMNGSPHLGNNPGNLAPNNMNMSNSHTPSPHQSNMAAPPMVPQHSQQGTNSSAASANTSPNINNNNNNKRRRSTVKLEGDDGAGPDGQNRVKPSPRMTKKAKP